MTDMAIVACARDWIGTRFHHQGRLKKGSAHKGGVDCLGLLVGVAGELQLAHTNGQLLALLDETDYSHSPDTIRLQSRLAEVLESVPVNDMQAGDIVLLRIDGNPQHLAIVSNREQGLGLIHSYAPARAVVEHDLDAWWHNRIQAVFRYSA